MKYTVEELQHKITELKQRKGAIILSHYYTRGEVQAVADFTGDSLALARKAALTDAPIILFAGVRFMGETAKVLCPDKKVLIPAPEADCTLARSCPADDLALFKSQHPDALVVSYVNTTAEVKALTDVCCTSSNAVKLVESIPADRDIIFAPDKNLAAYIESRTGRKLIKWIGSCHVHNNITPEAILALKAEHPGVKVLAHPECRPEVLALADMVGSTSAIIKFCAGDDTEYIIVTENGILWELSRLYPGKTFYTVKGMGECRFMKMITLEKIYDALLNETPEIEVDGKTAEAARKSIERMIEIK